MNKIYLARIPFPGYIITEGVLINGEAHFFDYTTQTLKKYAPKEGEQVLNSIQLTVFFDAYLESRKTQPEKITSEQWFNALECLPPCRWGMVGSFEVFHISERICGNLVDWLAKSKDGCYRFIDADNIDSVELLIKLQKASEL